MRRLSEIENDIQFVREQIAALYVNLSKLNEERNEFLFSVFCKRCGINAGDIVETIHGEKLQILGLDKNFTRYVNCHKIKKNGEPYISTIGRSTDYFDGCKVVGHINLN